MTPAERWHVRRLEWSNGHAWPVAEVRVTLACDASGLPGEVADGEARMHCHALGEWLAQQGPLMIERTETGYVLRLG